MRWKEGRDETGGRKGGEEEEGKGIAGESLGFLMATRGSNKDECSTVATSVLTFVSISVQNHTFPICTFE